MKTTALVVLAALALAGCGDDHIKPMSISPDGSVPTQAAQTAPAAPVQAQAAPHSESGSWFLPAAVGYLLGSMGSSRAAPAPQVYTPQAAPAYVPTPAAKRPWWKPAPKPTAVVPRIPSSPPVTTTPSVKPSLPRATPASKPMFSGPSSYKAPSVSFKPSRR
jgi:hypothetical protein